MIRFIDKVLDRYVELRDWVGKNASPVVQLMLLTLEVVVIALAVGIAVVTFPIWCWFWLAYDTINPGPAHVRNPYFRWPDEKHDARLTQKYPHNQAYWGCSCGYDGEWIYPSQCNELKRRVLAGTGPPW